MLSGLDHLVVTVTDMGRAVDFYSRVLGLDVRYRDAQRVDLLLGDTALRLHQTDTDIAPVSATPTPGSLDLCLRCQLPLDEFKQHLDALEVDVELGPVARQGANGPIESLYLRDPDGNLLEICRPAARQP
ncbi:MULTISPECIES: VOC family protein [Halomonadaceae]|uniref:Ring-cleaving dioxygenase n=2 Tax=Halomonadaceae TaxID=28256 RepID=A0A8H9IAD2_9GAMM|nr:MULTISPECIES: VOC family protein [Halomonas]ATH78118.1 bleomycin resistance protein [Halomonas hydrothermalis]NGO89649.1 VOC family protein [Halomonas sp.]KHJ52076.1 glyoxalase/bleomycin resistance protein/dioxygenase [Halomonas hydrothermalis]PJX13777.1 bleomycin resistance protein [Halomonas sp. 141]UDM06346.1 VOC family protein [Halomonas sp. NyZ770]